MSGAWKTCEATMPGNVEWNWEHCFSRLLGKMMCCFYGIFMQTTLENTLALYTSFLASSNQICAFAEKIPRIRFYWAFPGTANWLSKLQLIISFDSINVYMLLCVLWARWYCCCYLHCRCNLAQMVLLSDPQMSLGYQRVKYELVWV